MLHAVYFTQDGVTYAIKNLPLNVVIKMRQLKAKSATALRLYIIFQVLDGHRPHPTIKLIDWKYCNVDSFEFVHNLWCRD